MIDREVKREIRDLEERVQDRDNEIVNLRALLAEQGGEVQEIAGAAMEVRGEDVEQLAAYRKTNTGLLAFVEKIADSQSKFRKEARNLLGM